FDPGLAKRVARGEHPVADRERVSLFLQRAHEARKRARTPLRSTVVRADRAAMDGGYAQHFRDLPNCRRQRGGAIRERRREAQRGQLLELDHKHDGEFPRFASTPAAKPAPTAPHAWREATGQTSAAR